MAIQFNKIQIKFSIDIINVQNVGVITSSYSKLKSKFSLSTDGVSNNFSFKRFQGRRSGMPSNGFISANQIFFKPLMNLQLLLTYNGDWELSLDEKLLDRYHGNS